MAFEFASAGADQKPLPYEPHLSFTEQAWRRLVLYSTRCPYEIGGLGSLEYDGRDYLVRDVFIVEQDVNDIATRLEPAAVHRLIVDMVERNEDPSTLQLWWHSHAEEGVFWSGEDQETIDRFLNEGMVSLVVNHRLRMLARMDRYQPKRTTSWLWIDRPEVDPTPSGEEMAAVDAEIEAKIRHIPRNSPRIF